MKKFVEARTEIVVNSKGNKSLILKDEYPNDTILLEDFTISNKKNVFLMLSSDKLEICHIVKDGYEILYEISLEVSDVRRASDIEEEFKRMFNSETVGSRIGIDLFFYCLGFLQRHLFLGGNM